MSSWAVAITAASRAVSAPMTTTTVSAELEASNSVWVRATRNTPAVTMVAAWISADTGVGPAMASGSHTYSGICALLPVQARNSSSAMAVAAPAASPETRPKTWSKSRVPNLAKIRKIASRNPTSPMRLAMNAFLAAAGTSGLVNQKPISRYEQRATPSPPRYMTRKFCASTSVSIAAAIPKAAAISRVASQPAAPRRRRPTRVLMAKPPSGSSGSSQTRRIAPVAFRASSPLEQVDVVDAGRRALAEDGHQDAEADDHLGGGDHHHEEGQDLPVQVAVQLGEGDERQVDGVQHQLHAHEHHDGVAPDEHSGHADGEQQRRQHQVPARLDSHGTGSSSRAPSLGPAPSLAAGEVRATRSRSRSPRSTWRLPSTSAPTAATTSSRPVASKANT